MVEPILCLVAFAFLLWVLVLKAEIQGLQKENRRLRNTLQDRLATYDKNVEIGKGKRLTRSELAPSDHK
jgi:hypothetical protein